MKRLAAVGLLSVAGALLPCRGAETPILADPVWRAMILEIDRAKALQLVSLEPPYFVQYGLEDADRFSVNATLGALVGRSRSRLRVPQVQVRVGSYEFDNTNYVLSDLIGGRILEMGGAPLDDDVLALRTYFWLATDRAYKGAVAAIARKRAALRNLNVTEEIPDFAKAERMRIALEPGRLGVDEGLWTSRVKALSALFGRFPEILASSVRFEAIGATSYLANSEGTLLRYPDGLSSLVVQAEAQCADGMPLRRAEVVERTGAAPMPPEAELRRIVEQVAGELTALVHAPAGEDYAGPVLFEGAASPQLFAQLLGNNLAARRRPVQEPGRSIPAPAGEFDGLLGSRVLPEGMDVVDDPTQTEWQGHPLIGHYAVDLEAVRPEPLRLVEKGLLKGFLATRQPTRHQAASNGRARLLGQFGANAAGFGNLFVSAARTVSSKDLRARLLELCSQRGKPYGLIVRALDFPSSASPDELRRLSGQSRESGSGRWLLSDPVLVFRLYPDGREELVRGLRFRDVTVRLLRDIVAAGDETHVFDYLANSAPFSLIGAGGYVAPSSVVAPPVLIEDMSLERKTEEFPLPPVVPPPEIVGRP